MRTAIDPALLELAMRELAAKIGPALSLSLIGNLGFDHSVIVDTVALRAEVHYDTGTMSWDVKVSGAAGDDWRSVAQAKVHRHRLSGASVAEALLRAMDDITQRNLKAWRDREAGMAADRWPRRMFAKRPPSLVAWESSTEFV